MWEAQHISSVKAYWFIKDLQVLDVEETVSVKNRHLPCFHGTWTLKRNTVLSGRETKAVMTVTGEFKSKSSRKASLSKLPRS